MLDLFNALYINQKISWILGMEELRLWWEYHKNLVFGVVLVFTTVL